MSLVPDKVRKAKKLVDLEKLDAFVDEGLAQRPAAPAPTTVEEGEEPTTRAQAPSTKTPRRRKSDTQGTKTRPKTRPKKRSSAEPAESTAPDWREGLSRAPSVAFSVRIPTPLLDRMRDVVAAVDGETLTSLLVEGASARVEALETAYEDQVGEPLPQRQEKVEL